MKKVIAGYFDYRIEKQKVPIQARAPLMNEGQIVFEADMVTPVMTMIEIEEEIEVRQRVWIPQQEVDLTEEEIKQREIDHEEHMRFEEGLMQKEIASRREKLMEALLRAQTESLIMAAGNPIETAKAKEDFVAIKEMINKADSLEALEAVANR